MATDRTVMMTMMMMMVMFFCFGDFSARVGVGANWQGGSRQASSLRLCPLDRRSKAPEAGEGVTDRSLQLRPLALSSCTALPLGPCR